MSTNLEDYYAILADPNADKWESVECRQNDPELWWFADELHSLMKPEDLRMIRLAIDICNRCPLKAECLEMGMQPENIRWGIWGGTFAGERLAATGKVFRRNTDVNFIAKARRLRSRIERMEGTQQ